VHRPYDGWGHGPVAFVVGRLVWFQSASIIGAHGVSQQKQMKGTMLRVLATTLGLCCAVVFTTRGADGDKKHEVTEEQKTARKELLEKYDKNKDGKLDKEEKQAITGSEDKEKLTKAGWARKKKTEDK